VIDWSSLEFARLWPAGLLLATALVLFRTWRSSRSAVFPDVALIVRTRTARGVLDRAPLVLGIVLLLSLTLAMMAPSVVRVEAADRQARDFVILVDTSRSMRHDTEVRRSDYPLSFPRRVGAFSEAVDDPDRMPQVGRYELARESLLQFLRDRRVEDRVAVMYFNDDVHPVSALTGDMAFVTEQLAAMDDYVNYGTDIAAALKSSLDLLERYPDDNRRTIILLTDAETRFTDDLEQQIGRLADPSLSFYLLWITTDAAGESDAEVAAFLELARTVGNVVTIEKPDSENLANALRDVGRMEAYRYEETRRRLLDLTDPLLGIIRIVLPVWLLLIATAWHVRPAGRQFGSVR
jgi:Mg-chelatase subunit ChlD